MDEKVYRCRWRFNPNSKPREGTSTVRAKDLIEATHRIKRLVIEGFEHVGFGGEVEVLSAEISTTSSSALPVLSEDKS